MPDGTADIVFKDSEHQYLKGKVDSLFASQSGQTETLARIEKGIAENGRNNAHDHALFFQGIAKNKSRIGALKIWILSGLATALLGVVVWLINLLVSRGILG